jgi:hypothetical protein
MMRRLLSVGAAVALLGMAVAMTACAVPTQTFRTAESPFPADQLGGGGPNQGSVQNSPAG